MHRLFLYNSITKTCTLQATQSLHVAVRYLCIVMLSGLLFVSCLKNKSPIIDHEVLQTNITLDYPYDIVVTTGFVYDIVSHIVGKRANIYQIMGTGSDPHSYTPTRSDIVAVYYADLVGYSGLHLEGNMYTVFNRIDSHKSIFAIAKLLEGYLSLRELGDGREDPHIWMDVTYWREATLKVGELIAKFDPTNAQEYLTNANAYAEVLAQLDTNIKNIFVTIPQKKRLLISSHDAFGYFGTAYDFRVYGIQGISTVAEASLKHVAELIQLIIENDIAAVFVETTVSDKYINALIEGANSKGHQLKKGGSLFADAMGLKDTFEGTYIGMIEHNAITITKALGGNIENFKSLGQH